VGASGQPGAQRGVAARATPRSGQLQIEVGIVLQSGEVRYIARREFHLLTKSAVALLDAKDPALRWTDVDLAKRQLRMAFAS
jgi:hypothetical protein